MSADYLSKWVYTRKNASTGALEEVTFAFSSPFEIAKWDSEETKLRIPSTANPNGDGEFAEDAFLEPRFVSVRGLLVDDSDDMDALRDNFDQLVGAAFGGGRVGKLYKSGDRFLVCRCTGISRDEDDSLAAINWSLGFKASEVPAWQSNSLTTVTLPQAGGLTTATISGVLPTPPRFTFAVSTAGFINVSHTASGLSFALDAKVGTYIVDCAEGTVTKDGSDALADLLGALFELEPGAGQRITITFSSGAALSADATMTYRARWQSG